MHEMLLSRRAVNFFSISRYVIMASRAESLMRVVCFAGSVFLWYVDRDWRSVIRSDIRDYVLWMRQALKRRRHVPTKHIPGSVNPVTGKRYAEDGYAPSTINHNL